MENVIAMNPKTIEIDIQLTDKLKKGNAFDVLLVAAFKKAGVKIDKTRYTYVSSKKFGTANMPHGLMCAMFIIDHFNGFDWKLPEFSGKYKFEFKGEYTY